MTRNNKTTSFYILVGLLAGLALLLLNYGMLRLSSSLGMLYAHLSNTHFALYVGLTLATAIVFGISTIFFVYQMRQYGIRSLVSQSGGGIGAVVGIFASSCPVCGTTLLSLIGVAGSLSSLPFQGLELKALSFVLVLGSLLFSVWWLRRRQCSTDACPVALDDSIKPREQFIFAPLFLSLIFVSAVGFKLFASDIINSPEGMQSAYSCQAEEGIIKIL